MRPGQAGPRRERRISSQVPTLFAAGQNAGVPGCKTAIHLSIAPPHPPTPFCQCLHLKGVAGFGFRISFILKNRVFVMSSFRWSSPHPQGRSRPSPDRKEEATPEMGIWIWTYGVIMRDEGGMICNVDKGFCAGVFSGLG